MAKDQRDHGKRGRPGKPEVGRPLARCPRPPHAAARSAAAVMRCGRGHACPACVEHVHPFGLDSQGQCRPRRGRRPVARCQSAQRGATVEPGMHDRFGAKILDPVEPRRKTGRSGHQMLGPQPKRDLRAFGTGHPQIGQERAGAVRPEPHLKQVDRVRPDKGSDLARCRPVIKVARCPRLGDPAGHHHDNAVRHRHRLGLVMRDIDKGPPGPRLQGCKFRTHLHPQPRIEIRQRFVEQKDRRVAHQGAADRHALLLPARQSGGFAPQHVLKPKHCGDLLHAGLDRRALWPRTG
jgi:hypothetical protein